MSHYTLSLQSPDKTWQITAEKTPMALILSWSSDIVQGKHEADPLLFPLPPDDTDNKDQQKSAIQKILRHVWILIHEVGTYLELGYYPTTRFAVDFLRRRGLSNYFMAPFYPDDQNAPPYIIAQHHPRTQFLFNQGVGTLEQLDHSQATPVHFYQHKLNAIPRIHFQTWRDHILAQLFNETISTNPLAGYLKKG